MFLRRFDRMTGRPLDRPLTSGFRLHYNIELVNSRFIPLQAHSAAVKDIEHNTTKDEDYTNKCLKSKGLLEVNPTKEERINDPAVGDNSNFVGFAVLISAGEKILSSL